MSLIDDHACVHVHAVSAYADVVDNTYETMTRHHASHIGRLLDHDEEATIGKTEMNVICQDHILLKSRIGDPVILVQYS